MICDPLAFDFLDLLAKGLLDGLLIMDPLVRFLPLPLSLRPLMPLLGLIDKLPLQLNLPNSPLLIQLLIVLIHPLILSKLPPGPRQERTILFLFMALLQFLIPHLAHLLLLTLLL